MLSLLRRGPLPAPPPDAPPAVLLAYARDPKTTAADVLELIEARRRLARLRGGFLEHVDTSLEAIFAEKRAAPAPQRRRTPTRAEVERRAELERAVDEAARAAGRADEAVEAAERDFWGYCANSPAQAQYLAILDNEDLRNPHPHLPKPADALSLPRYRELRGAMAAARRERDAAYARLDAALRERDAYERTITTETIE
jgi:hypothetical protein